AVAAAMFLPWMVARFCVEGFTAIAFWNSNVEDWRTFARMIRWIWLVPLLAGGVWLWFRCRNKEWIEKRTERTQLLAWGTLAFIGVFLAMGDRLPFGTAP